MEVGQEVFRVALRHEDWVTSRSGWRCEVARFADVEKLEFDSVSRETRAEGDMILWLGEKDKRPAKPIAVFKVRAPASKADDSRTWKLLTVLVTGVLGLLSTVLAVALPAHYNEKLREKELRSKELIADKQRADDRANRESTERLALAKLSAEVEAAKKHVTEQRDDCAKALEYKTCVSEGDGTVNCNNGTFDVGILKCLGIDSP